MVRGLGYGAQIDAPQRRIAAVGRDVGVEAVVLFPDVEVFGAQVQRDVADELRTLAQVERVTHRDVFQADVRCVVDHQVARHVRVHRTGARQVRLRVAHGMPRFEHVAVLVRHRTAGHVKLRVVVDLAAERIGEVDADVEPAETEVVLQTAV